MRERERTAARRTRTSVFVEDKMARTKEKTTVWKGNALQELYHDKDQKTCTIQADNMKRKK